MMATLTPYQLDPNGIDYYENPAVDPGHTHTALTAPGLGILVALPTGVAATDTAAVNAAIAKAQASQLTNCIVFADGGTGVYLLNGVNIGGGSPGALRLKQETWNTVIRLAPGANTDVFTTGGTYTRGLVLDGLHVDINGANQTAAANGLNGYGCVWSTVKGCWFENPYVAASLNTSSSAAVRFFQNGTGGFGQGNIVEDCLFWNGSGSTTTNQVAILMYQSDENIIRGNRFQGFGTSSNTYPSCVFDQSGLNDISGNSFVVGSGIYCGGNGSRSRIHDNIMDGCSSANGQIYAGSSGVKIQNNHCYNIPAGIDGILVDNTDHIVVTGNTCETAANAAAQSGIHLGGTPTSCIIEGNTLSLGSGGSYTATGGIKIDSPTNLVGCVIRSNIGFNPSNPSAPTFPLTTVAYTNSTGIDVFAVVVNGTGAMTTQLNGVTGPAIGTSATSVVPIPANSTFKATYASGSPSWTFVGN